MDITESINDTFPTIINTNDITNNISENTALLNITCNKNKLLDAINIVLKAISGKYTMDILLKGTYFDTLTGDTYVYVGLKKDKAKQERTDYKDKFISPSILQWESENNVTIDNSIGIKLKNTKNVYVFVRKMDNEDNIILPFTYFGTGKFTNMRESNVKDQKTGATYKTLLFDIKLDNIVPEEYFVDFEIPNE